MRMLISCAAPLRRAGERYLLPNLSFGISAVLPCALLALLLLAAGACGNGSEDPGPSAGPSTPAATRSATPSVAAPSPSPPPAAEPEPTPEPTAVSAPPDTPAPTLEPAPSVSLLTVVDKQQALPPGYVPPDLATLAAAYLAPGFGGSLRAEAKAALERMLSDAFAAGHDIYVRSAYRSYAEQERTLAYWVSVLGEAEARRVSAEPGHSEHQLGTAADLTSADVGHDLTEAFAETPSGRWLAENAYRYGFALSYPAGAEAVTGYAYEPWHYRYIGPDQAAAWRASGLTLVEYLRGIGG
jgi:zinc D-Ala-D-Ala carboxypeptidase